MSLNKYIGPWTEDKLTHLLRRTMFGYSSVDIEYLKHRNMEECIEILLKDLPLPTPPIIKNQSNDFNKNFVFCPESIDEVDSHLLVLKGWWIRLMLKQNVNIIEKMTLFWHNHFVTEFSNVKDSRYAYQYINLIRTHALGNFKQLTKEITLNPCMLVYLNGNLNDKAVPNENYGRELQELFTIGKGNQSHYTESDVKAVARVLSGWKDDREKINFYFDEFNHDTSDKVFSAFYNNYLIKGRCGQAGANETDELMDMIFSNTEVSRFLCRKLYRWFINSDINEDIERDFIAPLADLMVQSDYQIKPVLKSMLSSNFFYNRDFVGSMFKSPLDYLVGTLKALNVKFYDDNSLKHYMQFWAVAIVAADMGQNIGDPPNVAGWPAYYESPFFYRNWVNSENLAYRYKMSRLLTFPEESDNLFTIDFIDIIEKLPMQDKNGIIEKSLSLFCCIRPSSMVVVYLSNILDDYPQSHLDWENLWSLYRSNQIDNNIREQVSIRVRKMYDVIFTLAESQIM